MPSSTPSSGRPGAPTRHGIGGLLGLLAVLVVTSGRQDVYRNRLRWE
jgi:hypothetical protein